jgi:hypothetical protein
VSVILIDLGDEKHDLQLNWWNWRPILAFLHTAGLINDEQADRMGANGCGGQLNAAEAAQVAVFLRRDIIPRINDGRRMHADGQVSAIPETPRPILSLSQHELYAAHKSCIESFASFCESCKGFTVS